MKSEEIYREIGYLQGMSDGKRTRGKISKRYINNLFRAETEKLTAQESQIYKTAWQEGFTDAVRNAIQSQVLKEKLIRNHLDKIYGIG